MISKWIELKPKAIALRKKGHSLKSVSKELGISPATLSGWFRNVVLSEKQKAVLRNNWKEALKQARKGAVNWHHEQKLLRLKQAETEAQGVVEDLPVSSLSQLELALAMLYWGEGYKGDHFGIGNSDPQVLKFFLAAIETLYAIDRTTIRCELNLRADQEHQKIVDFWSKELGIQKENFKTISFDKRTIGSVTYPGYRGVCQLRCSGVATQRRLLYLSKLFCDRVILDKRG